MWTLIKAWAMAGIRLGVGAFFAVLAFGALFGAALAIINILSIIVRGKDGEQ